MLLNRLGVVGCRRGGTRACTTMAALGTAVAFVVFNLFSDVCIALLLYDGGRGLLRALDSGFRTPYGEDGVERSPVKRP